MPRTPGGRLRAPTDAEINLGDHIAVAAVSAVVEQGWTPPDAGWIPPARPDIPGQFDLLAPPTTHRPNQAGNQTTEPR